MLARLRAHDVPGLARVSVELGAQHQGEPGQESYRLPSFSEADGPWPGGDGVSVCHDGSEGVTQGGPAGAGPCGRDGGRDARVWAELAACGCRGQAGRAGRSAGSGTVSGRPLCRNQLRPPDGVGCRRQGGMRLGETSGAGRRGHGCAGAVGPMLRRLHHRFLPYGDCTCGQSRMVLGWRGGDGAVAQAGRFGSGTGREVQPCSPSPWLAPGHRGARQSCPCPCPSTGYAVAGTDFAPSRRLDLGNRSPARCIAH